MPDKGNSGNATQNAQRRVLRAAIGLSATMQRQAAKTRREVRDFVKAHSGDAGMATRADEREAVYNAVLAKYRALADAWRKALDDGVERQNEESAGAAAKALPHGHNKPRPLTAEQKIVALNGRNVGKMVAVATENMGEHAVRDLRVAAIETFRLAKVEGWNDNEIHKHLQEAWDAKAGNTESHRFVDSRGRSWSNAAYLQMLTRTTLAKIDRNAQVNTLVGNGYDLARISDDGGGDVCDACERWSGKVVSLTGATKGLPTLADAEADGLFHPNCVHRLEYLDADEIEAVLKDSGRKQEVEESTVEEEPQERDETPDERAKAALHDLSGFDADAAKIATIADADKANAAIDTLRARLDSSTAAESAATGAIRETLRKALEVARKKYDDARAAVLDRFGGSPDAVTWARMHKLGIEKESMPMPFKQAGDTQGRTTVNPHYGESGPDGYRDAYTGNCQRCVTAEELRQRGYRVEAKPTFVGDILPFGGRWMDAYEGGRQNAVFGIPVGKETHNKDGSVAQVRGEKGKAEIVRLVKAAGDGARGIVRCGWYGRRDGHVFNVRNEGGKVMFYDAQTGTEDASGYFRSMNQERLIFLRTDNLKVSGKIGNYVSPKQP